MTTTVPLPSRSRSRSRSTTQDAKPLAQRLAMLLAIALSLPLLYAGSRLLLAAIAAYQTQAFLDDWTAKGEEPSPRAWQVAHDAAQHAVDLHPGDNGEYLQRLGHVQQWKQYRQPFRAAEAEQSRRAALEAFRAASRVRPTWPANWTALAYAKLYLLELDGEFTHALEQARNLGPTRLAINRSRAEIGLIAWPQLDTQQRQATLEAARMTVNHSTGEARKLLEIAEHTGMTAVLCDSLAATEKQDRKICQ